MAVFLTYHGIGEPRRALAPGEDRVWLSTGTFLRQLDFIAENRGKYFVTFDDGNKSDLTIVLPEILKRNLTARFFVLAGRTNNEHFLSAEDIRELNRNGMSVGSHGMNHVPWRGLDTDTLREEICGSKAALEDALSHPISTVACPFGSYDRRSLAMIEKAGYRQVFTSDRGIAAANSRIVARNSMTEHDTPESIAELSAWNVARSSARKAKIWLKRKL